MVGTAAGGTAAGGAERTVRRVEPDGRATRPRAAVVGTCARRARLARWHAALARSGAADHDLYRRMGLQFAFLVAFSRYSMFVSDTSTDTTSTALSASPRSRRSRRTHRPRRSCHRDRPARARPNRLLVPAHSNLGPPTFLKVGYPRIEPRTRKPPRQSLVLMLLDHMLASDCLHRDNEIVLSIALLMMQSCSGRLKGGGLEMIM